MKALVLNILLCLPVLVHGLNEPLVLEDFAYAAKLQLGGQGALYELGLPESVYAGVTRVDLGDVRIFNQAGAVVPHAMASQAVDLQKQTQRYSLALFPLLDDSEDVDRLRLRVQRGGVISELSMQRDAGTGTQLSGYLLDARQARRHLDRFSLSWDAEPAGTGFMLRLDIDASDDLETWRRVVHGVTVADLQYLGRRLKRNLIDFPPSRANYYRLRFSDPQRAIELSGVQARGTSQVRRFGYTGHAVPVRAGETVGEYLFETPGQMRVRRLGIFLPEINTLVAAGLYSRPAGEPEWRLRSSAQLYRLRHEEGEINHPDIQLSGISDREWKLVVAQDGGGLGNGLPRVRVDWRAHRLVFVARGQGPFTLAWGSSRARPPELGPGSPLRDLDGTRLSNQPAALIGEIFRPGGDAALTVQVNWRQLVLWSVLIFGALLLVGMALRLFRQMDIR